MQKKQRETVQLKAAVYIKLKVGFKIKRIHFQALFLGIKNDIFSVLLSPCHPFQIHRHQRPPWAL